MSAYCLALSGSLPVALVLGFFVSIVVDRWVAQLGLLPWPDRLAMLLSAYVCDEPESTEERLGHSRRHSQVSPPPEHYTSESLAQLTRKDEHALSTSSVASTIGKDVESRYSSCNQLDLIYRIQYSTCTVHVHIFNK